jgi:signal transduction histidine kinase
MPKLPLPPARMSAEEPARRAARRGLSGATAPVAAAAPELPAVATLTHDLRSPLAAVLGFARLAREDLAAGDTARAALLIERIERSASMLEAILESARERGRAEQAASLASVLEQIRDERRCELEGRSIRLLAPDDAPALAVGGADLYRLMANVIGNAIDHMGARASATIAVSIACSGDYATLRVSDNGVGIAVAERELVFDAAHSRCSGEAAPGHSGLGLTIVRQLAESWGGHAWFEPTPQPGATLCVTIPVAR